MAEPFLSRAARWLASLTCEQIPAASLRAARYQLLDTLAAAVAAARSAETASIAEALSAISPAAGRCTVIGQPTKHAPHDAAHANAAYSMAQDFDDIVWMGHTGHSAVFAALAVAEHEGADAKRLLAAMVAANEVAGRLGASTIFGPLNGQMWTFIHLVGAAAATTVLLGLDAERATHALAISLAQPNFALQPGFLTPSSKLLAASTPTATGIHAAYLARAGMTGAPQIVEDKRGFWSRFSYHPLPVMTEGLGELWTTETLTIKTYPGCHYFQTACTALERLAQRLGPLREQRIESIEIATTKLGIEATRFAGEYAAVAETITPVNVNFDLGVTAAIMVLAGRLTSAEVEPELLASRSQAIHELRGRIEVTHDPALTLKTLAGMRALAAGRQALASFKPADLLRLRRRYRDEYRSTLITATEAAGWLRAAARALGRRRAGRKRAPVTGSAYPLYFPNRVTLHLRGGRTETERVDLPVGSLCSADCESELEGKFLREVSPSIGSERAAAAFAAGLELGERPLEELLELLG